MYGFSTPDVMVMRGLALYTIGVHVVLIRVVFKTCHEVSPSIMCIDMWLSSIDCKIVSF